MGRMSKLLDKPFRSFSIYALIILVCSIPVYYLVVDAIWLEELDEHNLIVRNRLEKGMREAAIGEEELEGVLAVWSNLQPGTKLVALREPPKEMNRVYTVSVYNPAEREEDRFRVLASAISVKDNWYLLTISTNVEEAGETLSAIALVTVFFFVCLVLGFVLLNKRIAGKSWRPFYKTLEELKKFDLSKDRELRLESSDIEEFEELNREVMGLIKKNAAVYDQQKRFVENASHELQTPLAILKTKMDVLLQNEALSENEAQAIETISASLARITRINKNLLLLAKIENDQFQEETEVDLQRVLKENSMLLEDYLENKRMQLRLAVTPYAVRCNPFLFDALIGNLLINAIRHGSTADVINVELNDNKLIFSNAGTEALNPENLFVRFGISAAHTTGSGLGLAIAKEICDRYGWKISYRFIDSLHTFCIEF